MVENSKHNGVEKCWKAFSLNQSVLDFKLDENETGESL